jgi:putative heme-binding domain-containing protein
MRSLFLPLATLALVCSQVFAAAPEGKPLVLAKGDRIALVGNTLAERMQHSGHLEALIQARFPDKEIVIRNLGFSADEIVTRLRSQSFGTPDEWLTRVRANVIFAFFGYNESFGGSEGLPAFREQLDAYLKHLTTTKFDGQTVPRVVLFSPIAHENLHSSNLPDGCENNKRLEAYNKAMAEVAAARQVVFIDLFSPTLRAYTPGKPWTINGIHLNNEGNSGLARIIEKSLFQQPPVPEANLNRIRQAVIDKNHHWFARYRTTDGYSVYGGRSGLVFAPENQTNFVVMQREMEVLDVMTANRDKRIWAVAQGGDLKVDDSNTPAFLEVKTNKPGPLEGGKHKFLSGEDSIALMKTGKNLKVNLFASEETFPELANPVQMSWDTKGRLWVAVWPTYPHFKPKEPMNDKLLILEDTDGDGKADKMTTFADDLHCPTGFELWNGGVIVAQTPDLWFLKDTDGDGKADVKERIVHGLDSADTHHASNSFVFDPAGGLYFQEGTFHHTQVESPWGAPRRCANAGVFRFDPRRQKFEVYITYGFANPHGHVFDRWGQDIVVDGTGANPYHAALFSGHLDYPNKHNNPPQVYQQRTRPCPGMEYLSSPHFPEEYQNNLLVGNVIGFQGILRYKIEPNGGSYKGTELEPVISSTDPNFRPSDMKMGPDGAIYFIDWHNPIIGHMQHNLRDPSRDRTHGRIYRITHEGRPLAKQPSIAGKPIAELLDVLKNPTERVRYAARLELGSRDPEEVVAAARTWVEKLDKKDPDYEHHLLEILWLHQSMDKVSPDFLRMVIAAREPKARAAAVRVLSHWLERIPESLDLLRGLAKDEHPLVRLESVRAASFLQTPEALDIPFIAAEAPQDPFVEFVRGETLRALEPHWKKALADKRPIELKNEGAARFLLRGMSVEALLAGKKSAVVFREILSRPGIREEIRRAALRDLAQLENKSQAVVALEMIRNDSKTEPLEESVLLELVRLLGAQPPVQLEQLRPDIEKLALSAPQDLLRQIGWVILMNVDGTESKAWELAVQKIGTLRDLVKSTDLISDSGIRARLYPKLVPLLKGLPTNLDVPQSRRVLGRYVRIELPGPQRTLTLAEVEIDSDGNNIARQGKATQSSEGYGGTASRAIDGNKSGSYGDNGQTHSAEGTPNPWWEVDLGGDYPIDQIRIYNRTDGNYGQRMANFTVKVLDQSRAIIFEKFGNPAPAVMSSIAVGGLSPERAIRAEAMLALTGIRGQEENVYKMLGDSFTSTDDRQAAIRAMLRLPGKACPTALASKLVADLLKMVKAIPAKDRTGPIALEAMELADNLIGTLAPADGTKLRTELGEIAVRVIRLGTLPERMAYDKEVLVVKAGRPVEFVLSNSDLMPHNFVITQPGAMEEIGMAAENTATQPDAQARHFVPKSDKVLLASGLLQPRESQRLSFVAPKEPGVYPYVCTYPGHWRRMFGSLYVVADPDAYQAAPEAYLAANKIEPKDGMLKDRRPRTEWKVEDLSQAVTELSGRSHGNGKLMFKVATCVACHKMENEGNVFGPDLTQLDPKWGPQDILREIIIPSHRIHEKYQSEIFEMDSGKVVTGIVLDEKDGKIRVMENPLASTQATILDKSKVESRKKSTTSAMPKGLLDKLTRDEVLDLMAYIVAKGDRKHPAFKGDGHNH